ncbi:YqaJ viral recombinase family protein [Variovorax sp. PDNC026]|uniref:YqaJ viral recombinase family nuclease n=1 Tax=Variovorax sp. PDNC026 TaxID=2811425 RepID=UPI0019658A15|nr:YqaJ viral recombinase family protein [Variovorax sp. PDNC026]QRY31874.1 YqaJ viral recombinase family protein [Variovorax sp. PDNC026]
MLNSRTNTQGPRSARLRSRPPALQLVQITRTPEPTPARWPNMHEADLGTMDAAAALGCDPFKSTVRLWMEKTGRQDLLQPLPEAGALSDGALYWSRLLEPIVAAHYTLRTGRQVRRTGTLPQHPQHSWMVAHSVREVVEASEVQLLECRCVGMDAAVLWADGLPAYVQIQMLHVLAVTGAQAIDVVALMGGQELRIHRVERDEVEISRLIDAEREFWRCVELDEAPPAEPKRRCAEPNLVS